MRISRIRMRAGLRAGLAGVIGMTLIGIATPAWATPEDEHSTPTPTPTATSTFTPAPQQTAEGEAPQQTPTTSASPTESASPTPGASGSASATPSESATPESAVQSVPTEQSPTPTPPASGDDLEELSAFMASFGIHFPDVEDIGFEDFVINPLALTYTCTPGGPDWTLTNNGADPLGVGWFDTDLGGSFTPIAGGESLALGSHALAVIAHPVDAEGNVLVTVPAVGVSFCDEAGGDGGGAGAGAPVVLPQAGAATPVSAEPYYTG